MIADECHYLKNDKAQRTQETLGKYDKDASKAVVPITSKRKLFLTGTPILNRPIELWPLLKSLGVFTNWMRYVERYCAGHQTQWGWDVSGSSHLDELQDTLRSTIMVRRLKKDVLTELPPKRRMVVEVPANGAGQAVEAEAAAYARHEQELDELRVRVEIAKASEGEDEYKSAVDRLREAAQVAFTEMSVLRHQTALAKVPAVIEHAVEALEGGTQKLVIFAHHHDVIAAIMAGISAYNPVRLTGEMGADNRQASVDKFQADESCRVFIGSIQAAGLGLTLTASAHVLFAELDWVPGNITQAEDRCHRIGQTDSVLVQHLVLEDSLDARMAKTLVAKQQVIDAALDKIEAQTPLVPEAANGDAPATTHSTRREIEKLAEQMTPEMISSVHAKLRFLAGICDGAQQLDGMGFNKFDARLGHSLANMGQLTARQAALGSKLVRKYRRQLGE
jgi:SWI/SNF-related matrix-associated actin-dependent regulator 1 of chromatin subfamily A